MIFIGGNKMDQQKNGVEDLSICSTCKGKCCKSYPGPATPKDFGAPDAERMYMKLYDALSSGRWTIDWINQEEGRYFIRPATKGFESSIFDHRYAGECTFLTSNGCELPFRKRTESCRMLVPKLGEKCDSQGYTRAYVAKMWQPYVNVLIQAATDVEKIDMQLNF